jgi:hypothetical protein
MATFSVLLGNLTKTPTSETTLEECRNSIIGYFEQYPDAGIIIVVDDETTEVEELWHWCETCGVYNTKHCPCVAAELRSRWL